MNVIFISARSETIANSQPSLLAGLGGDTQGTLAFTDEADAIRMDAVDRLHAATAIYTASPVVDQLLDRLNWPNGTQKLLDPSCGDGMFLSRALDRLLAAGKPMVDLTELVEGWEIHPGACSDARNRVTGVLIQHGYSHTLAASVAQRMVRNLDFLVDGPTGPYAHTIAGNPPYLRRANVPALLRETYDNHVPAYASADLLYSFLERCSRALHDGGRIGYVTSDRWLTNQGSAKLREKLGERLSLSHLERLDPASCFYRPKQRRAGSPPRIHPVSVILNRDINDGRQISSEPIFPGVDASRYAGLPTLAEIAKVRIAPWLGSNGVFVVDAHTARSLPKRYLVPAVDTDDIVRGKLGEPTRFAILTSPDEMPCEEVMQHLNRNMHRMAARGRQGKAWQPPETFHNWDLSHESLIVPRIAKSPKAVRVPPGILPINHNLSIVSADPKGLDMVEKALASPLAAEWARDHAPRLENSYYSLTTTMLRKLPVSLA